MTDSKWDKPGVATQIRDYWSADHGEQAYLEWVGKIIRGLPSGSVLDVGCGIGRVYAAIRDLPNVTSYVGVDSSTEMLAMAAASHPEATWKSGSVLGLEPESADTVLCLWVLCHIPGDLVAEFASLISAARKIVVVVLWTSDTEWHDTEVVAGERFPRITRNHEIVMNTIASVAPGCTVQVDRIGETACYTIRM